MSRGRYDAELSGYASPTELEGALRAELSAAPSPDFEARVMRRIADRSATRSRRRIVYAPLAAAALVVIATALVVQRTHPKDDKPSIAPSRTTSPQWAPPGSDPQVALPPVPPANPPAATPLTNRSRRNIPRAVRPLAARSSSSAAPEPEVIVPPGQADAIRRLVRAIAEGRLAPPPVLEPGATGVPAAVPVQPLTIQPILVSAAEDRGGPTPFVRPQ
ncbi:MAG TPA: hypothetical protein VFO14_15890 [Vicinamibacterales bacterium]|nr:hypothetical protein [Vicinamibacterales bacterium]